VCLFIWAKLPESNKWDEIRYLSCWSPWPYLEVKFKVKVICQSTGSQDDKCSFQIWNHVTNWCTNYELPEVSTQHGQLIGCLSSLIWSSQCNLEWGIFSSAFYYRAVTIPDEEQYQCFVWIIFGQEVETDLKDLSFESFSMFYHNCIFTPDVSWRNCVMSRLLHTFGCCSGLPTITLWARVVQPLANGGP